MLSFNFSKKVEKSKLVDSKFGDKDEGASEEQDFVHSIEGTNIKGTKKSAEKKKELVIPLITKNTWKLGVDTTTSTSSSDARNGEGTSTAPTPKLNLEQQAIQEILDLSKPKGEEEEKEGVPILLANKVPEGYEDDNNLNVDLRPEMSSLDDYERIPIEQFGMAMLRGMGWKENEGIGLKNKRVVQIVEPQLRPKGLGLGAERPQTGPDVKPTSLKQEANENLSLKKGAFITLNRGSNRGMYAKVEAFDEDNNRVIVKLAISGKMVTVSMFQVTLVPESEYKKKAKILNSDLYDEYKEKQDKVNALREKEKSDDSAVLHNNKSKRKLEESSSKAVQASSKNKGNSRSQKDEKQPKMKRREWVIPNLRVRFIDDNFKNGKYYERKFIVEEAMERDRFVLKSESGEIVEDVRTSQLETVIPKNSPNLVCVLSGRSKGKVGKLIDRDRRKQVGVVELPDEGVLQLSFDDICEFIGNIEDYF